MPEPARVHAILVRLSRNPRPRRLAERVLLAGGDAAHLAATGPFTSTSSASRLRPQRRGGGPAGALWTLGETPGVSLIAGAYRHRQRPLGGDREEGRRRTPLGLARRPEAQHTPAPRWSLLLRAPCLRRPSGPLGDHASVLCGLPSRVARGTRSCAQKPSAEVVILNVSRRSDAVDVLILQYRRAWKPSDASRKRVEVARKLRGGELKVLRR